MADPARERMLAGVPPLVLLQGGIALPAEITPNVVGR
jgi:hypothetical protein